MGQKTKKKTKNSQKLKNKNSKKEKHFAHT